MHAVATILEFLMSVTVGGLILAWVIVAARQGRAKAWVGALGRAFFLSLGTWLATSAWIDFELDSNSFYKLNRFSFHLALGTLASLAALALVRVLSGWQSEQRGKHVSQTPPGP